MPPLHKENEPERSVTFYYVFRLLGLVVRIVNVSNVYFYLMGFNDIFKNRTSIALVTLINWVRCNLSAAGKSPFLCPNFRQTLLVRMKVEWEERGGGCAGGKRMPRAGEERKRKSHLLWELKKSSAVTVVWSVHPELQDVTTPEALVASLVEIPF